mmetsp:Transcript_51458/g.144540  ORF Transcript_51458/g.144540 Transcript_51458/m.144540 type:complete len:200 (-) Transcript_51458:94-693(-)
MQEGDPAGYHKRLITHSVDESSVSSVPMRHLPRNDLLRGSSGHDFKTIVVRRRRCRPRGSFVLGGFLQLEFLLDIDPVSRDNSVQEVSEIDQNDNETRKEGVPPSQQQQGGNYQDRPGVGDKVGSEPISDFGFVVVEQFSQGLVESRIELFVQTQKGFDDSAQVEFHNGIHQSKKLDRNLKSTHGKYKQQFQLISKWIQ